MNEFYFSRIIAACEEEEEEEVEKPRIFHFFPLFGSLSAFAIALHTATGGQNRTAEHGEAL